MSGVKRSFIKKIGANLTYWLGIVSSADKAEWLSTELANVRSAITFGAAHPETAEAAGELTAACFAAIERASLEREWLPTLAEMVQKSTELSGRLRLQLLLQWGNLAARALQYDPEELLARLEEARRLATDQDDRHGLASAAHITAIYHHDQARYSEAIDAVQQALPYLKKGETLWAAVYTTWGIALLNQGNLEDAEQKFAKAAKAWAALNNHTNLIRTRNHLARVSVLQGKQDRAMRRFDKVLTLLKSSGDEVEKAVVQINQGALLYSEERFEEAVHVFQRVNISYLRRLGRFDLLIHAYHGQGDSLFKEGRPEIAVVPLREAIQAAKLAERELSWANSTGVLAQAIEALGDRKEASRLIGEAVSTLDKFPQDEFAQKIKKSFMQLPFYES